MDPNYTETLDAMKTAQGTSSNELAKSFTQGLGLVAYDLQAPALQLYPFMGAMTMLRNDIPRVAGAGDTATRWKAITGINTGNTHPGVAEGQRGGYVATTLSPFTAAYIGLGLEDFVSFEADYAAMGFDDAKAKATLGLLRSLMIQEEQMLLTGNASNHLGVTPDPTLSAGGTGATLPAATYSVIAVALTPQGLTRSSLASGVVQTISKTNADGSSDSIHGGAAGKSGAVTQAVTLGQALTCTVDAVDGAAAYAWFVGAAGSEKLEAITSVNQAVFSKPLAGTHQAASAVSASDLSYDSAYNFDGMLNFATAANGASVKALAAGATLTSDGAGGVVEINDLMQSMYDKYRMGITDLLVSSAGIRLINKLCIGNGSAPLFRFNLDGAGQPGLAAGATIGSYLNPITNELVRVRVHPFMPAGTILGYAKTIPYPLNGVGNVFQVKTRRDYYQLEWPLRSRKYEYGVYADEVLQHYAPFTLLKLHNVTGA